VPLQLGFNSSISLLLAPLSWLCLSNTFVTPPFENIPYSVDIGRLMSPCVAPGYDEQSIPLLPSPLPCGTRFRSFPADLYSNPLRLFRGFPLLNARFSLGFLTPPTFAAVTGMFETWNLFPVGSSLRFPLLFPLGNSSTLPDFSPFPRLSFHFLPPVSLVSSLDLTSCPFFL